MTPGQGDEQRVRWIVRLGALVIRALASTWRYRVVNAEAVASQRAQGKPIILALWHGQMLVPLWHHRDQDIGILISEHRDGEIIAQIAESLRLHTVRGSTSRGGGRALIGLVRALSEGHDVAITPDGPRGPAGSFAPGALVAAQRSGAPIIAIGVHAPRAWRLQSWDRFVIPKPFSRVHIAYSDPAYVEAATPREAAGEAPRFQQLMNDAVARAEG
ncbi:MAG: lysophospholipid acyltransferase family protein [Gemmatimonadaceae bacterium]|nr:lysophospholipid acyltransferase family protein [Gemmatimonadaceae bacterium]